MKKKTGLIRLLVILAVIALLAGARAVRLPWAGETLAGAPAASASTEERAFRTLKKGGSGTEVRKAQEALKALGFYDGRTDGNFSRAFEEAVVAFQEYLGVPADGRIDEELYLLLLSEAPDASPAPSPANRPTAPPQPGVTEEPFVVRGEDYTDKEHVAAYLHAYGELPPNYITKEEARELGWVETWGNLWKVAPEMSIGGDYYGNYEGLLPTRRGRNYYECDIDYDPLERNGGRNAKRIIYSNDGLIFYTEDHYQTFEEITFP